MKRLKRVCALFAATAVLLAAAGCKSQEEIVNVPTPKPEKQTVVVNNEAAEAEHWIEVSGTGEIMASPDFATITLGVTTSGETAELASAACQAQTAKAVEAAHALNMEQLEITQRGVELEAKQKEGSTTVTRYEAADVITVVLQRVAQAETVLTALMQAGDFEFCGITYSITDASEAYRRALAAATEDAYAKATVLAEATGVTLGRVVGVVETDYDDTAFAGKSFESSAIAVSAHVTVRYLIG